MSSARKGKKAERELARKLNEYDVTAERVPRSVADALPGPIDDVIVVPGDVEVDEDTNRPITNRLQSVASEDVEEFTDLLQEVTQIEVKRTSSGAYGASGLLSTHLETCGLGTIEYVEWASGHRTGGLAAFLSSLKGLGYAYVHDESLADSTRSLLDDADAAALRVPRKPWVLVWGV